MWNRTVDTVVTEASWNYLHHNELTPDVGHAVFTVGVPSDEGVNAEIAYAELVRPYTRTLLTASTGAEVDFGQDTPASAFSASTGLMPQFKRSYYGTSGMIHIIHPTSTVLSEPESFALRFVITVMPHPGGITANITLPDPGMSLGGVSLWSHLYQAHYDVLWQRTLMRYYGGWWDTLQTTFTGDRLLHVPVRCRAKRKLAEHEGVYLLMQPAGVGQAGLWTSGATIAGFNELKSRVAIFS